MTSQPANARIQSDMAKRLVNAARLAAGAAYVPYSRFPVGAAVLTVDGNIVTGTNIENASYGLTVCGERVAVFAAVAAGHREIAAVAISAPRHPGSSPCGACRQVLNEFKPPHGDMMVLLDAADGIQQLSLSELLPMSFGPRDLA